MMNYYQDITLSTNSNKGLGWLWKKVYQQVHIALADNKVSEHRSAIAVAFPEYDGSPFCEGFRLGNTLRLLAKQKEQLTTMGIHKWLDRLANDIHIGNIEPVPQDATPVSFVRHRSKGKNRLAKDMISKAKLGARKSGKTFDECLQELKETETEATLNDFSDLPFIYVESIGARRRGSNKGREFPLLIKGIEASEPQQGEFNCYGLSIGNANPKLIATVPHFAAS